MTGTEYHLLTTCCEHLVHGTDIVGREILFPSSIKLFRVSTCCLYSVTSFPNKKIVAQLSYVPMNADIYLI